MIKTLKTALAVIYLYVDGIEPFVLLFAALLYLVHFFLYDRYRHSRLPCIAISLIAVSAALTLVIVGNRFL